MITLPEVFKFVSGGPAAGPSCAANALSTGDYVCLKNVHMAYCVVVHQGANDTDLTISFKEATAVAGTGAATISATLAFWTDDDWGSGSDTMTRQTDAANDTIDPATENPVIQVWQIDPAKLSAGYDCVACVGTNGDASNDLCVLWLLQTRYAADQPPTAITD